MASFGRNGRFMTEALRLFGREQLLEHLSRRKVPQIIVDDLYYFPASLKASDIRDAFLTPALEQGLILKTGTEIAHLDLENGRIRGVVLTGGTRLACEKFILCSGGTAMLPRGTAANGLALVREAGHKITPPLPAMAPLFLAQEGLKQLAGLSLPEAVISLVCGNISLQSRGTLLFTHDGLSGMAALNCSDTAYRCFENKPEKLKITVNFAPDMTFSDYCAFLEQIRKQEPEKLLKTALSALFPRALAAELCAAGGLTETKAKELKNNQKEPFAKLLSAFPLVLEKLSPMEKAMAMSGGVSLKETDPCTMQSRLVKGLFFAGEILDLTGPCGGFNIQFALSSGYLAGFSPNTAE